MDSAKIGIVYGTTRKVISEEVGSALEAIATMLRLTAQSSERRLGRRSVATKLAKPTPTGCSGIVH